MSVERKHERRPGNANAAEAVDGEAAENTAGETEKRQKNGRKTALDQHPGHAQASSRKTAPGEAKSRGKPRKAATAAAHDPARNTPARRPTRANAARTALCSKRPAHRSGES